MRPNELWTRPDNGTPPGQKPLVVNGVVVGPIKDGKETCIASNVVKVKKERMRERERERESSLGGVTN
jgi:hypothetical protein